VWSNAHQVFPWPHFPARIQWAQASTAPGGTDVRPIILEVALGRRLPLALGALPLLITALGRARGSSTSGSVRAAAV
jgi:hypothetical protein